MRSRGMPELGVVLWRPFRETLMLENRNAHTPGYWLEKAREARSVANGLATEANRRQMLAAAENYERLAEEAKLEKAHAFSRSA